jgi:hypothetical protein
MEAVYIYLYIYIFIYLTAIGLLPGGSVDKKKKEHTKKGKNIHSTKKQLVPHEITQHEYNDKHEYNDSMFLRIVDNHLQDHSCVKTNI